MKWIFSITFCILLFSLFSFYWVVRPFRIVSSVTPQAYGLKYEDVSFKTNDGITLRGWFLPAKIATDKAIILLHGYPADKGNILPVMMFLQNHYNLFLFDFRYFGQSGGHYTTVGKEETEDLLAAIRYLKSKDMKSIGVWGFSMGAAVALMTATQTQDIKMIVADSSFARLDWMGRDHYKIPLLRDVLTELMRVWAWIFFRYDLNDVNPADAAAQLKIPVLFVYSQDDNVIPPRHGDLLKQKSAANPYAIYITQEKLLHGELPDSYRATISDFFKKL